MTSKKLKQILSAAVDKENKSVQFYKQLAQRIKTPEVSAVFEAIAKQEEKHAEAVKLELFKMGFTFAQNQPPQESFESEIVIELECPDGQMSYLDALHLALQRERAAFRLYAELMAKTTDPQAENLFFELAQEEMRHILQFEREIAAVGGQSRLHDQ